MDQDLIIKEVKKKKELRGLADSIIQAELTKVLRSVKKENLSSKEVKQIVKETRARLRYVSGQFVAKDEPVSLRDSERNQEAMKHFIEKYHAKIILDIGCGLNPLDIAKPGMTYYAYDIREDYISAINAHLKKNHIKGSASVLDARTEFSYPFGDLAFVLKLVDLLDAKGHKVAEQLLRSLPVHIMVVSFATKTLSGKRMNHPQRGWIERLCTRLGFTFESKIIKDELFYIIKR